MNCPGIQDRIHAYMDGELDLVTALGVEQHLSVCPACRYAHAKHEVSRTIVRRHATIYAAPPSMRTYVLAQITPPRTLLRATLSKLLPMSRSWFGPALAMSVALMSAVE